ncbi:hypothetical protein GMMP15_360023 [Candidatus Magnetomoraceae bacterium gMMP-15]
MPVTLWLTDFAMDQVAQAASDFFDYCSSIFILRAAPLSRMDYTSSLL